MTVNGFNFAAIPSLEKQFHFNSKQTGLMSTISDISNMILTIIVSFYGSFGNKPRWIGLSMTIVGLSLILFSVPHFMIGKYHPPEGENHYLILMLLIRGSAKSNLEINFHRPRISEHKSSQKLGVFC